MKPSITAWVLIVFSSAIPAACLGGSVHGQLRPPGPGSAPPATFNAYPGSAKSMPGMHHPPHGLVADAVVYLEGLPADYTGPDSRPAVPRLSQKDQAFVPRVVAVERGGTVDFPNLDPIFHNVFSVSPTRRFDLGKYPRGHSKQVTFPKTGLVKVYCDIHSDMEAFILVVPSRAFGRPDASGAFEIPSVPPGKYTLRVWHPDLPELTQEITVPSEGDVLVSLAYGS